MAEYTMAVHTITVPHLLHTIESSLYLDRQLKRPYILRTAVMNLGTEYIVKVIDAPPPAPPLPLLCCPNWILMCVIPD